MCHLAIEVIAGQTGEGMDAIAEVLDELAGRGLVSIYRNGTDAFLCVRDQVGEDHVIVHAERQWLRFQAHRPADPALN
jgi:hypothetical protein